MKKDIVYTFGDYTMRLIKKDDIENYYTNGILNASEETSYFTGTIGEFTVEDTEKYLDKITADENRYDFIILDKDSKVIGEVVLNEKQGTRCNYRIAIFNKEHFSKGIGYSASKLVLDYAFKYTDLETITLDVFPFNERGIRLYEKLGFCFVKEIIEEEEDEPYKKSLFMELKKK